MFQNSISSPYFYSILQKVNFNQVNPNVTSYLRDSAIVTRFAIRFGTGSGTRYATFEEFGTWGVYIVGTLIGTLLIKN
jgi:hypothetical protein